VSESREALGTTVSIEIFTGSADVEAAKADIERAFGAVSAIDQALNPYSADTPIARFNANPYVPQQLPEAAVQILDRVAALEVTSTFSPAIYGVTNLYRFGDGGSVPTTEATAKELGFARNFRVGPTGIASFAQPIYPGTRRFSEGLHPGLDFGGASKGLAMDRAASVLRGQAVLLTCGSSTLAIGTKPDGKPWRVGIEDPREVGKVIAIVSAENTLSVSTSGDYQTYFEKDGIRYHHILDPATGRPARGLRSLTVFGRMSGVDADILSTALFVMGKDDALDYAKEHGVGIYLVDDKGTPASWAPRNAGVILEQESKPVR
jgi:thiamine biosynthesis lipoprotein